MRLLKVLFDSGSEATMFNRNSLPSDCRLHPLSDPILSQTTAGKFATHSWVQMEDIILPEFDRNRRVNFQQALVFDGDVRYDVILGRDFLGKAGIKLDHELHEMQWMNNIIPMKERSEVEKIRSAFVDTLEQDNFVDELVDNFIMDAKYEEVDTDKLAMEQQHLTHQQREDLKM